MEFRRKIFYVKNEEFESVVAFYRDVMGLAVVGEKHHPPWWVEFDTGACRLCIHHERKDMETRGNNQKLVFCVPDAEKTHAELTARGAPVEDVKHSKDGSRSFFFLRDPAENYIEINEK